MNREKILILKGFRIGDAICQTPAVALLRKIKPDAQIDLTTTSDAVAEVFQNNPNIDNIILSPSTKKLQKMKYDYAISFEPLHVVEKQLPHLNCEVHFGKHDYQTHLSQVMLDFLCEFYKLDHKESAREYYLYPSEENIKRAKKILLKKGFDNNNDILVGMHMGCYKTAERASRWFKRKIASHRTWPFDNFRLLAEKLYQFDDRIRIVLTGTKGERKIAQKIFKKDKRVIHVAGETSVLDLAAMMNEFKLFITGDTGPMHIATAMKTPMIAMFGSTKPEITGPFPVQPYHTIIVSDDMSKIPVEEIYQNALKRLR